MYIGDTDDGSGLHHMAFEIIDNAVDEAQAGFATRVELVLNGDGSVTVTDNGRGIPIDIHPEEGNSRGRGRADPAPCGRKIQPEFLQGSGGLHGVGAAVVNALSEWTAVPYAFDLYSIATREIAARTFEPVPLALVAVAWYLLLTSILMVGQYYLERYYSRGASRRLTSKQLEALAKAQLIGEAGHV